MLSTEELREALATVKYPHGVAREERREAMKRYHDEQNALILQWKEWLQNQYADGFSTQAADVIYNKAWMEGHSDGYHNVESWYQELVEMVTQIKELDFV